jgi:FkbM family methyltransferase
MSIEHREALSWRTFATVIDVGANRGQFALFARLTYPHARVICFEPLPEAIQCFREIFADDHSVSIEGVALGEQSCEMQMHVTAEDDSSSLLQVGERQCTEFGTAEVRTIEVAVRRLDECLRGYDLKPPILLKLDVQGSEASVLRGCGDFLSRCQVIYLEGSYVELYKEQPLIGEIVEYLRNWGFHQVGAYNQAFGADGSLLQADFLFKNEKTDF